MILRPKPSPRHHGMLVGAATAAPVPAWLRRAIPDAQTLAKQSFVDVALAAGAAIGTLDQLVRREEKWARCWRQRLALAAAAVAARQAGRIEDEAALRDAVLLTRPGDDVGPAGHLLLAWRRLATRPAEELLTEKSLGAMLEDFGHVPNDEVVSDLVDELRQLGTGTGTVETVTGAVEAAERHRCGRVVGAWLADALVAQLLGWTHAVPLLGTEAGLGVGIGRQRRAEIATATVEVEPDWAKGLLAAQARAALRAIDLFGNLERRTEKLLTVAPKLRAKGADAIVDRLLNEDALVASRGAQNNGMSDRGLRRLFDRLIELGAVRELSGRPTFRIYGL